MCDAISDHMDTVDRWVLTAVRAALPDVVSMDDDLKNAGLDSLAALAIMTALEEALDLIGELDVTAPFHIPTATGISDYLREELANR